MFLFESCNVKLVIPDTKLYIITHHLRQRKPLLKHESHTNYKTDSETSYRIHGVSACTPAGGVRPPPDALDGSRGPVQD